jgi:hypothetical protein
MVQPMAVRVPGDPGLSAEIRVFVHPINTVVHPGQAGYRWAVHVGAVGPSDLGSCVNAGQEQTELQASVVGEMVGSAATRALRAYGIPTVYSFSLMGFDPLPAAADEYPLAYWPTESKGKG